MQFDDWVKLSRTRLYYLLLSVVCMLLTDSISIIFIIQEPTTYDFESIQSNREAQCQGVRSDQPALGVQSFHLRGLLVAVRVDLHVARAHRPTI